jgi:hypothetical protein
MLRIGLATTTLALLALTAPAGAAPRMLLCEEFTATW